MIFPAPPQGREPAYPDNLVKTSRATFLFFEGKKVVAYFHGNGEDLAASLRHPFDAESKAPAIALPVLIVHGTEDEVVPLTMGERLARLFPHAQLVPLAGGQHNDLLTMHAIAMREALSPFLRF